MIMRAMAAAAFLLSAPAAWATADGPDFYRVTGADAPGGLAIRADPDAGAAALAAVPEGTTGLRNLGCRGGLSFAEWQAASEEARAAAALDRWCRVEWFGVEGWAAGRFLGEGAAPPAAPPGPDLGGPRRWRVATESDPLNLRAAPGLGAPVLDRLPPGAILTNLGCEMRSAGAWCDVQPMQGGARGWVAARHLAPAAGPNGDVPFGYDDSALRAGQGEFDATGQVPCAFAPAQPMGRCDFGVARGAGGDATLVIDRPDGFPRAIFYVHGQAVGADTAEAEGPRPFSAARQGDLTQIQVGPERYEIPDAAPLGG